ncbi:hypothetical protein BGZ99_005789 [Dissophora globulifera]|uniref:Uncharacterized protein n=1 Tax=Dissophora globulifera TaxID=979702 RepID=A0A9P6RI46_9FUNG|nr:hypothetical protein BGZ99_005789 [Dissophora globulifera]
MHSGNIPMEEFREKGFRKADAILLKLFEGFDPEEEVKISFTSSDKLRWRGFCNSKRQKQRIAWNKYEWRYFLRTCDGTDLCSGLAMAEIGQLGNSHLDNFKTSTLFGGTDLENCIKGIKMLRGLMIETAEKMRQRLPKLLEEHSELIVDIEDSDNNEAQESEELL